MSKEITAQEQPAKKSRILPLSNVQRRKLFSANTLKKGVWSVCRFILLLGLSFIIIYPFLVKISSAFMGLDDLMDPTVWMIPRHPTFDNIMRVLNFGKYWEATKNTLIISVVCAFLQTFMCTMIGYGLAKFKFRGRGILFAIVVMTIIIPPSTIYISLFMHFRYVDFFGILQALGIPQLNLIDTLWPVVILSVTGLGLKNGLYIFVMRQFFRGVPQELNEAAWVDGSGPIKSYFRIMLPMAVPMMVSIFLLSFSWQWTDTFYSDLFFKNTLVLPNILGLISQISSEMILANTMMSSVMINTAVIMIVAPLFIFYLFSQRFLIQGIERSGIVG